MGSLEVNVSLGNFLLPLPLRAPQPGTKLIPGRRYREYDGREDFKEQWAYGDIPKFRPFWEQVK
jgi:hypothetical protein